jgi:hypothetical protein
MVKVKVKGKGRMVNLGDLEGRVIVVDRNIQGPGLDVYVVGLGGSSVMKPDRSVSGV